MKLDRERTERGSTVTVRTTTTFLPGVPGGGRAIRIASVPRLTSPLRQHLRQMNGQCSPGVLFNIMYIIGTACNINDLTHITEMEATYRLTHAKEMQWRALYAYFLRARREAHW